MNGNWLLVNGSWLLVTGATTLLLTSYRSPLYGRFSLQGRHSHKLLLTSYNSTTVGM